MALENVEDSFKNRLSLVSVNRVTGLWIMIFILKNISRMIVKYLAH